MLDIPLDRVIPPYLHRLLGIKKTSDFAADELDRLVFRDDVTNS